MEAQLRSLGGVLQLFGVGVVAWELHLAIAKYRRRPSIADRLGTAWNSVIRWLRRSEPKPATVQAVAASLRVGTGGRAHAEVTRDPATLDTEEKIEELFKRVDDLKARHQRTEERIRSMRQQHAHEVTRLDRRISDLGGQLHDVAEAIETGDVRWRTAGFLCVMYGIVLATWSRELGDWGFMVALAWAMSVFLTLRLTDFDE